MGLFSLGSRRDAPGRETSKRIAAFVRETLSLGEEDAVSVSQIDCGDPTCEGGAETFILVMRKGQRTQATKVPRVMALIGDADITEALKKLR